MWTPVANWGWKGDTDAVTGFVSYSTDSQTIIDPGGPLPGRGGSPATCTTVTYSNWVYYDGFGTVHQFDGTSSKLTHGNGDSCPTPTTDFTNTATGDSGYTLSVSFYNNASVSTASGQRLKPPVMTTGPGTVTDANGNQLSVDSSGHFTDTTGHVALTLVGGAPSPRTFTYTDTLGNLQSVSVTYASYVVQTAFGCARVAEYSAATVYLVDRVTFSRRQFLFLYV